MKCGECLVPPDAECAGERIGNRRCGEWRYVALFRRLAEGPSEGDLFANAAACPHREPIPEEDREGCGCSHRCGAGHGREPDGRTDVLRCWECPIAPRHQ